MAQKSKRNLAADTVFRDNYASLHSALAQPNVTELASQLYEKALITPGTRDDVQFTKGITLSDRAASLLRAVESSIKSDHRRFRQFIRILRDNHDVALKRIAIQLRQFYSKPALHDKYDKPFIFILGVVNYLQGNWFLKLDS